MPGSVDMLILWDSFLSSGPRGGSIASAAGNWQKVETAPTRTVGEPVEDSQEAILSSGMMVRLQDEQLFPLALMHDQMLVLSRPVLRVVWLQEGVFRSKHAWEQGVGLWLSGYAEQS